MREGRLRETAASTTGQACNTPTRQSSPTVAPSPELQATQVVTGPSARILTTMIVTHTKTADGQCRVYLGAKGSLEFWIEPTDDKQGWTFHLDAAVTGNRISPDDQRQCAIDTLSKLANELGVAPADLAAVPFEAIAALHTTDPYAARRMASSRRRAPDHGFMSTLPHITRPASDYRAADWVDQRRRGR